ncbi:MAG: CesT family type III secretion system chaperone [Succinimonas sp.]|nr:CesT family type III secretion system chaperone [Succinimonas sp.]
MSFSELMASFAAKTGIETDGSRGGAAFRYEDLIILLQEAGDLLLLRTDLGFIDQDAEKPLLREALKANFAGQGAGGAIFALNPADNHLHLQRYDRIRDLDAAGLEVLLRNFAETAMSWTDIIDDFRAAFSDSAENPADDDDL